MAHRPHPNPALTVVVVFYFFLSFCGLTYGRFISGDGTNNTTVPSYLRLFASAEETSCEQTYGFMPCTTTAVGNLLLIVMYGYLMFLSATYLSYGSEMLLEILGPGLVGGLLLPMLGSVPDAILILVSGVSGSTEVAQSQVLVGIGLLAGSTVVLLTLVWGACIVAGKCDIENSIAIDTTDTKGFSLTGSGITTDIWTSYAGIIMAISVVPFIIAQLPPILHLNSGRHLAVLIALIVSVSCLISYCLYQVFQPWIQSRRLAYAKHKHIISGILKHFKMQASTNTLGRLANEDGTPNQDVLRKLFDTIDDNGDNHLSRSELKALIVGIQLNEINLDQDDAVEKLMKDFDTSRDSKVNFDEFVAGIRRWLAEARSASTSNHAAGSMKYIDYYHLETKREHDVLGIGDQSDEVVEGVENPGWNTIKAVLLLVLGTAIAAAFADPLVDAVNNFSDATRIPTFFISFVALPLATSSEAVSAIIFAARKKCRSASLSFSALYGSVTMNNCLCLPVFLGLVYARGLIWDFTSEVLVILIVCAVMGIFASVHTTFPLWTALVAFLLYPFSLALVYVLDYVFGWS